jgi:enoyl-CoA hydratase/carnithine racemase
MSEADLLFEVRERTATVTFNRPAARNAMTWDMYERLVDACDRIDADDAVRVAVLRGAGGAFVAGTDITQFREFSAAEDGLAYERRIEQILDRLERVRVPTIAAVEGYAVGGGLALAASCDLRICAPSAKFGLPIARTLGNCVSMRTYARLADLVGSARALHLIYTATFMSAADALAAGLVTEVVPDGPGGPGEGPGRPGEGPGRPGEGPGGPGSEPGGEPGGGLDARLGELCNQLAGHAPLTMWASKQAFRRLRDARLPDGDDLIAACYGSEDFREGVQAFTEKRPARWQGR